MAKRPRVPSHSVSRQQAPPAAGGGAARGDADGYGLSNARAALFVARPVSATLIRGRYRSYALARSGPGRLPRPTDPSAYLFCAVVRS